MSRRYDESLFKDVIEIATNDPNTYANLDGDVLQVMKVSLAAIFDRAYVEGFDAGRQEAEYDDDRRRGDE